MKYNMNIILAVGVTMRAPGVSASVIATIPDTLKNSDSMFTLISEDQPTRVIPVRNILAIEYEEVKSNG